MLGAEEVDVPIGDTAAEEEASSGSDHSEEVAAQKEKQDRYDGDQQLFPHDLSVVLL